jgi:hypothetical protein
MGGVGFKYPPVYRNEAITSMHPGGFSFSNLSFLYNIENLVN